ncbi:MAG: hypothetical protein ACRECZ_00745 [Methylocella sp.]
METPLYIARCISRSIRPGGHIPNAGKAPAWGTISRIKRLVAPVITVFTREPSGARGSVKSQSGKPQAFAASMRRLINKNTPRQGGESSMRDKRMKMAVARVLQ